MQINLQAAGTAAQPRPIEASNAASVDFQSFLRLLTAQLRNQDPLSPLDSTQFVAQLASFSTVEQLVSANARLDALGERLAGGGLDAYADWIGRVAEISGLPALFNGAPIAVGVAQRPDATRTEIIVRNAAGVEIDRFAIAIGASVGVWTPTNAQTGGVYSFEAAYEFSDGSNATAAASTFAAIDAVRETSDGVVLELENGLAAAPAAVVALRR